MKATPQVVLLSILEEVALVAKLVTQVAEDRGRLVADLPRPQRRRHLRQRLELLAHAEPIGRRGHRHGAVPADPRSGRDIAVDQVITALLDPTNHGRELELQGVDGGPQTLGIVVDRLMPATEIADRRFQFREGCNPYPYHERRLPNICLGVNTLTPETHEIQACF